MFVARKTPTFFNGGFVPFHIPLKDSHTSPSLTIGQAFFAHFAFFAAKPIVTTP